MNEVVQYTKNNWNGGNGTIYTQREFFEISTSLEKPHDGGYKQVVLCDILLEFRHPILNEKTQFQGVIHKHLFCSL